MCRKSFSNTRWLSALLLVIACTWTPSTVRADDRDDRIAALERQLQQIAQELNELKAEQATERASVGSLSVDIQPTSGECPVAPMPAKSEAWKPISIDPPPPLKEASASRPVASSEPHYFTLQQLKQVFGRHDEFPTLKWSGFFHIDGGWIAQDEATTDAVGDADANFGLRRVRLIAAGKVREHTRYKVDLDFAASGHPSFRDVALTFEEVPFLQNAAFGYFKQPIGMAAETSGRNLLFLERPLPFALVPFRQTGFETFGTWLDKQATYQSSLYLIPTDSFGVFRGGSGGLGFATRLTGLPYDNEADEQLVHTGFGFTTFNPGDDMVRYSIEPGFATTEPQETGGSFGVPVYVDTGPIPTNSAAVYNFELAAASGPWMMQSEVRWSAINQIDGPDLVFPGAYVQTAWVLTGESHVYDRTRGVFQRVHPQKEFTLATGGGAWELALEWAYLDLNSHNIRGGRLQDFIVGVNWYLHRFTKIQFNYILADLDDPDFGRGHSHIAALRAQVEF